MKKLQKQVTVPKEEYDALKADVAHLTQQAQYLLEQVRLGKHRQFWASSEMSEYDPEQVNLFNEAETLPSPSPRSPAWWKWRSTTAKSAGSCRTVFQTACRWR